MPTVNDWVARNHFAPEFAVLLFPKPFAAIPSFR